MADLTVHDTDTAPDTSAPASPAPSASRREALRDTLVAAGLVATIASASSDRRGSDRVAPGRTPVSTPAAPQPGVHTLSLVSGDLHSDAGWRPEPGQTIGAYATLTDVAGTPLGRFYATIAAIDDLDDLETMARETHTFVLGDATLIGSGISTIDDDLPDTFAIIGGTGRYLGARGQYVAMQHHADFGGDGTASYEMTIIVDQLSLKGN